MFPRLTRDEARRIAEIDRFAEPDGGQPEGSWGVGALGHRRKLLDAISVRFCTQPAPR